MSEVETMVERRDVFFLMVFHPLRGKWIRVGKPYVSRKVARSWVSFTKKVWHGLPVEVEKLTVVYIDGQVSDESRHILDEKFNMDA